ncbi:hypothetical protein A3C89_01530 [Candidatus Kaiserbacteria bacterium RIFCSPHIGHO2_02_FULL_50_50]|uniref:Uncharacterized protein n=1 Tax=Candidatus Kaiserbacteria bacterium RIFCSPHIGHO2_02_FULL_50_50 TaxID=1798492 RepID=A0A1F6DCH2_9BACT|nr:MAG: hypothetical protein A3C89_01530 [Candidatus Kaiserbacteria bacterium RIFCSPHIGHO2_02_FULL_50_50]OGG89323.1 MAG: hypothetical protein A3G62_01605 [Candidatus Kaiserbacteria bacterium RIFCSPLOWO2_12_FULL_50_10]
MKTFLYTVIGSLLLAPVAYGAAAQTTGALINPLKVDSVEGFLLAIIDVMLTFALPIVVLFMMWTGFQMVMARGNAGELTAAKKRFLNVLVGTLVIFGAKVILEIIQATIKAF